MILDRFGREVPITRVRESIGFVKQQLLDEVKHDVNAPSVPNVTQIQFEDHIHDPLIARTRRVEKPRRPD